MIVGMDDSVCPGCSGKKWRSARQCNACTARSRPRPTALPESFTTRTRGHTVQGNPSRRTPTYGTWASMKRRCRPDGHYGRKGITVCERWSKSFANFLSDMGERPDGTTIDRIDNARGYEPGNCRWATHEQQVANKRPPRGCPPGCACGRHRSAKCKPGCTCSRHTPVPRNPEWLARMSASMKAYRAKQRAQ